MCMLASATAQEKVCVFTCRRRRKKFKKSHIHNRMSLNRRILCMHTRLSQKAASNNILQNKWNTSRFARLQVPRARGKNENNTQRQHEHIYPKKSNRKRETNSFLHYHVLCFLYFFYAFSFSSTVFRMFVRGAVERENELLKLTFSTCAPREQAKSIFIELNWQKNELPVTCV